MMTVDGHEDGREEGVEAHALRTLRVSEQALAEAHRVYGEHGLSPSEMGVLAALICARSGKPLDGLLQHVREMASALRAGR